MLKHEIRCAFLQDTKEIIVKEGDMVKITGREWENDDYVKVTGKIICIDTAEYECLFIENKNDLEDCIKIPLTGVSNIEVIEKGDE